MRLIQENRREQEARRESLQRLGYGNLLLLLANTGVFLYLLIDGDPSDGAYLYGKGALYPPDVWEGGAWWRLLSACFLHFDLEHLANNMLMLCAAGSYVERAFAAGRGESAGLAEAGSAEAGGEGSAGSGGAGRALLAGTGGILRYLLCYLLAGACGNLVSLAVSYLTGDLAVSAGASGAVFGIVGALAAVALKNKGKVEGLSIRGILFMAAMMTYAGYTTAGVNNSAHIGGLLGGFLFGLLLYRRKMAGNIEQG